MSAWQFFMLVSFVYGAKVSSERSAAIMQMVTLALAMACAVWEVLR